MWNGYVSAEDILEEVQVQSERSSWPGYALTPSDSRPIGIPAMGHAIIPHLSPENRLQQPVDCKHVLE
jgi:hypothetical protein